MIGIYCWANKITQEKYVGQSTDIEKRRKQHIKDFKSLNTKLAKAVSNYGLSNFEFSILEECLPENLNEREGYWINKFDSVKNGYNHYSMSADGPVVHGELNPNTLLENEDVLNIRTRIFINNEYPPEVYKDYEHLISYDSFWQAFHGVTWQHVDCSMIRNLSPDNEGSRNPRAIMNEEEVLSIRKRVYLGNEEALDVFRDYKDMITFQTFSKIVSGETWKNVDCSMIKNRKVQRAGKPKAKLTKEIVAKIRWEYEQGLKTLSELYREYSYVSPTTIRRVINYETWKNIEPVSTIPEA